MRLGFYTGTLYEDSTPTNTIKECCIRIANDSPILRNEGILNMEREMRKSMCKSCNSCEEAQRKEK